MVHILKQLFMMNYIDTFHGSCISAVENLYQHYLILHLCNILIILLPYVLLWLSLNQFYTSYKILTKLPVQYGNAQWSTHPSGHQPDRVLHAASDLHFPHFFSHCSP